MSLTGADCSRWKQRNSWSSAVSIRVVNLNTTIRTVHQNQSLHSHTKVFTFDYIGIYYVGDCVPLMPHFHIVCDNRRTA